MIALYPGTFDPITHGHTDVIRRASRLFDRLIVAVAKSERKQTVFSLEVRMALVAAVLGDIKNIEICEFSGLTVDLATKKQACVIVRGVRASADVDYELQLANMNQVMAPDIETLFLAPTPQYHMISASLVREILSMGGDASAFVDPRVLDAWRAKS
jgi:pantetheine-phosphate adenylyltransferase